VKRQKRPAILYNRRSYVPLHYRDTILAGLAFLALAAILLAGAGSAAAEPPLKGEVALIESFHRLEPALTKNSLGVPLVLESSDRAGKLHVDVYGIFDHPYAQVHELLRSPATWCDIATLHPNVKACIYGDLPGKRSLTLLVTRKVHQPVEDAFHFINQYRCSEERPGYLSIVLAAGEGPLGTRDHKMRFEATPLDEKRTFVHVSYDYQAGLAAQVAGKLYFATFGRSGVGFTVTGRDDSGNPVYVGGQRGAIERNVIRYYLAIQSFMNTRAYPDDVRLARRISEWHDLSSRFRKQLYDMDKKEYTALKTSEYRRQTALQARETPALLQEPSPAGPAD
jgi:hypothetical protein